MKSGHFDKLRRRTDSSHKCITCISVSSVLTILISIVGYLNFRHFSLTKNQFRDNDISKPTLPIQRSIAANPLSFVNVTNIEPINSQVGIKTENNQFDFHFIHIPKCGGTSMTSVLRQIACAVKETKNKDCCTNPGFCDWWAHRRCSAIKGCTDHFPHTKYIFINNIPSITLFREPVSR